MRYNEEAYREVFPRVEAQPKSNVETACETFRPSEHTEQVNIEVPVVTVNEEEVINGDDGTDSSAD